MREMQRSVEMPLEIVFCRQCLKQDGRRSIPQLGQQLFAIDDACHGLPQMSERDIIAIAMIAIAMI
jgi:hypothetical protein